MRHALTQSRIVAEDAAVGAMANGGDFITYCELRYSPPNATHDTTCLET